MKFRFIVMLLSITLSFSALSQDRNHIVTKVVLGGQSDTIEVNAFARAFFFILTCLTLDHLLME